MVLAIGGTHHDGAVDRNRREAQIAQRMKRQQLESVTVVPASGQRFFEGRPMIDRAVFPVMKFSWLEGVVVRFMRSAA